MIVVILSKGEQLLIFELFCYEVNVKHRYIESCQELVEASDNK